MAKDEKKEEPEAPDPPMTAQGVINKAKNLAREYGVNTTSKMLLIGTAGLANLVADMAKIVVDGIEGEAKKPKPKRKKKAPRA